MRHTWDDSPALRSSEWQRIQRQKQRGRDLARRDAGFLCLCAAAVVFLIWAAKCMAAPTTWLGNDKPLLPNEVRVTVMDPKALCGTFVEARGETTAVVLLFKLRVGDRDWRVCPYIETTP